MNRVLSLTAERIVFSEYKMIIPILHVLNFSLFFFSDLQQGY